MTDEEVRATLARVDAMNASLAARAARREADGSDLEERYQERQRQEAERAAAAARQQLQAAKPPARPAPMTMDPDMARALNIWADKKITKFGEVVAEEIGEVTGKLGARLRDLEDRVTKSEGATVALIVELERRLTELEKRLPPVPRLVRDVA